MQDHPRTGLSFSALALAVSSAKNNFIASLLGLLAVRMRDEKGGGVRKRVREREKLKEKTRKIERKKKVHNQIRRETKRGKGEWGRD